MVFGKSRANISSHPSKEPAIHNDYLEVFNLRMSKQRGQTLFFKYSREFQINDDN